jgi:hypothetical protein
MRLFANHICTTMGSHPNFVSATCIDIDPIANTVRFLLGILFFGICDGQLAFQYKMGRKAAMRMGIVVGISMAIWSAVPVQSEGEAVCALEPTYGPSVQVNTCGNPQDRTSSSYSRCDLAVMAG